MEDQPTTNEESPPAQTPVFEGFIKPKKNYFPMPNVWIDICAKIDNLAELKVVQYVLRHTWGYQEYGIAKAITVEEFMHGRKYQDGARMDNGTGLKSDRSVKDGLKAAIKHGYLVCEIDATDKARIKKSYALKMIPEVEGCDLPPENGQVDATPQEQNSRQVDTTPLSGRYYPSGGQYLPPYQVDTTPRSEKDTLERHSQKDTQEKQETVARDSQTLDDSGATAPTHAPSTHAHSNSHQVENKPEKPGPGTLQDTSHQVEQDSPDRDRNEKGHTHAHASSNNAHRPAPAHAAGSRVAQDVPAALTGAGSVNETRSQLSTSQQGYPQAGAQVRGSARPALVVSNAPLFAPTGTSNRAQFTELGRQVCEWYEIIQATKVRRTNVNINACNGLAEEDGISFENLKLAIEHWEAHSYVKERNIPIDLQKLEDPSGAFTFAKAMLAIKAAQRMAAQRRTTQQTTVLPSHHSQTDDEYYASLRRTRA